MKVLAIAGTNVRRLFRQRANIFFVVILPLLLILLLGAAFGGGSDPRVGITGTGRLADDLAAALERTGDVAVSRDSSRDTLLSGVERGRRQAGIVVPPRADAVLARGGRVTIGYLARPDAQGGQLRTAIIAAAQEVAAPRRAATFAASTEDVGYERALVAAGVAAAAVPPVTVRTETTGTALFPEDLGRFDLSASAELLLFVFLTSLTGASALIEVRRLGISRRMLATPTPVGEIVAGEMLGRYGVALAQGLVIMLGSLAIFGVDWGAPTGAAAVLLVFCLVGAGAGMLLGSTLKSDQQAGALALLVGMGLAALGGSMVPIEFFPGWMHTLAYVTPHAWGNDAFAELVRRRGGLVDVLPQIGVLAAYAAVLTGIAAWRLRRSLTSGTA